jgi:hypothetical protein
MRSASATGPQPEARTFFVDRSLGAKHVVDALRLAGLDVIGHAERFAHDADDLEWLQVAGESGWVVLTKDANIRRNEIERRALIDAGVAAFMLARADLAGATMAQLWVKSIPKLLRALEEHTPPFIATLSASGQVLVRWRGDEKLAHPIEVRSRD